MFHLLLFALLLLATVGMVNGAWTSTNWAGYLVVSNGITAVSGSWIIPEVQCANTVGGNTVTQGESVWIGIDGVSGPKDIPEQIGTNSICYNGSPVYVAWEEDRSLNSGALMAFEDSSAGDHMTASVTYLGNDMFQLMIKDDTTSNSRTYTVHIANSPRASAEWIVEVPYNINTGQQLKVAHFQPVTFTDCSASVNNVAGSLTQNNAQPMNMVDSNNTVVVAPQGLNQAGTSFSVAET
jgi:hypothetical protein